MPPQLETFSTITLTESVNKIQVPKGFVRDKIFGKRKKNHVTKVIQVDVRIGDKKLAPFVHRGDPAKVVDKTKKETQFVQPPHIRMKKPLDAEDLKHERGVGQPVYVGDTTKKTSYAKQRVAEEQQDMKWKAERRLEWMCLQALFGSMTYVDTAIGLEFSIDYLMPAANKIILTGNALWSDSANATPIANIKAWKVKVQEATGFDPTMAIMRHEVATALLNTDEVKDKLNNRRIVNGSIDTTKMSDDYGVTYLGNLEGVDLFEYNNTYDDASGNSQNMLGADKFVLLSPSADFRLHYAVVEDLEAGSFAMDYFSKAWYEKDPSVLNILLESNPLPVPHQPEAIINATVL